MMRDLPPSDDALVLRTDFSDEAAWAALCAAIREPQGEEGFRASVLDVSDREYERATVEQLVAAARRGRFRSFLFVADRTTISHPDHPVLVIDLADEPGRTFRVIPSRMWSVENNLSLANMDFAEFAGSVHADGIFRGFDS